MIFLKFIYAKLIYKFTSNFIGVYCENVANKNCILKHLIWFSFVISYLRGKNLMIIVRFFVCLL